MGQRREAFFYLASKENMKATSLSGPGTRSELRGMFSFHENSSRYLYAWMDVKCTRVLVYSWSITSTKLINFLHTSKMDCTSCSKQRDFKSREFEEDCSRNIFFRIFQLFLSVQFITIRYITKIMKTIGLLRQLDKRKFRFYWFINVKLP